MSFGVVDEFRLLQTEIIIDFFFHLGKSVKTAQFEVKNKTVK